MVAHGFGRVVNGLQEWYNETVGLSQQQYWTVCSYADGIVINASANLHVFYSACDGGTPLPLLCTPHPVARAKHPQLTASFCGALGTHPVRKEMYDLLAARDGYLVSGPQGTEAFRNIMNSSWFALCPRGYGPTSYRLYEAIQMGCIPVYITDTPILPCADELDWSTFCVVVGLDSIGQLPDILNGISIKKRRQMAYMCEMVYASHFNMPMCCAYIKRYLEKRWPQ
jgi:hypothetical protein